MSIARRRFLMLSTIPGVLVGCNSMKTLADAVGSTPESKPAKPMAIGVPRAGIAPNRSGSCLGLSNARLCQLGTDELTVWDTASWRESARIPCPGPRGVLAFPDGGVVALSRAEKPGFIALSYLTPGQATPQVHAILASCHPTSLSRLYALGKTGQFAIASPNSKTIIDEFVLAGEHGPERQRRVELPHDAFFTLTRLRTGAWIYERGPLMQYSETGEVPLSYPENLPHPVHLARSSVEGVLIATLSDGSVARLQLESAKVQGERILQPIQQTPFLLDTAGGKLAAAFVSADYRVTILVASESGQELLRVQAPWTVSVSNAELHALRISDTHVVLGDTRRLAVWELSSGKQVFDKN